VIKNGGKIIAPVSVQRWALTSDMDGLLDFSFDIYGLFIKNLDPFPVDLVIGLETGVPGLQMLFVSDVHLVSSPEFSLSRQCNALRNRCM